MKRNALTLILVMVIASVTTAATAAPVSTSQLQRLVDDATRGQSKGTAQCMVAAIHYVWNGSRHEQIRWPKDNPGAIKEKSYYHDGSQVTEIVILAEGHVRDLEITDTYEPVSVSCMEIDGRLHSLHIAPIPK